MNKNLPKVIRTREVAQAIEENNNEIEEIDAGNDIKVETDIAPNAEGAGKPPPRSVNACKWVYIGFRFMGFIGNKKWTKPYKFLFLFIVIFHNPTSFIVSYIKTPTTGMEIGDLFTSVQLILNVVGASVKLAVIFWVFPEMMGYEKILAKLDARCKDEEAYQLMRKGIKGCQPIVALFFTTYFCYPNSTCISGVVVHRLPYNMYNPLVDHTKSNKHFMLAVIMQMVVFHPTVLAHFVSDGFNCIYANLLRLHVELLIRRIKKLKFDAEVSGNEANYEEFKMCIIDHKNIIELYTAFDNYLSKVMFIQYTITGIITSMTMINIFLFSTRVAAIVASGIYMACIILQMFPICYYCQCLKDEANRVPDVIFHSNWIDEDAKYRKLLVFFMQRTQQPMEYIAGKLYPISLASCLSVLLLTATMIQALHVILRRSGEFQDIAKFSFSLYTFFSQMNIKERLGFE